MADDSDDIERDFLDDFIQQTNNPPIVSPKADTDLITPTTLDDQSPQSPPETVANRKLLPDDIAKDNLVDNPSKDRATPPDVSVFKRPKSPSGADSLDLDETDTTRSLETASQNRHRKDVRLHQPLQRCLISTQKRKRPETDAGHLATILKELRTPGRLLLPSSILLSYLHDGGVDVDADDSKVTRLLGAAAEHHSASIIQDTMHLYMDGHHERRKSHANEKRSKSSGAAKGGVKSPAGVTRSGGVKKSTGDKPNSPSKKSKSKADDELEVVEVEETPMDVDEDHLEKTSARSTTTATTTRDEPKKKKDEKDDMKHCLTVDLLIPVLVEHGYLVGRPPYFVN